MQNNKNKKKSKDNFNFWSVATKIVCVMDQLKLGPNCDVEVKRYMGLVLTHTQKVYVATSVALVDVRFPNYSSHNS